MDKKEVKPAIRPKSRVVPSRYKKMAEVAQKNSANMSLNHSYMTSSDSFGSRRSGRTNLGQVNASSIGNLLASNRGPNKSPSLSKNRNYGHALNPKLHSTALSDTTFLEKTNLAFSDEFSTTVVGRKGLHSSSLASLAELKDISEICLTNEEFPSSDSRPLSKNKDEEQPFEENKDFTPEEIEIEFLKYLTAVSVDVKSSTAFDRQLKEGRKQITFLTDLIEEEEKKVAEEKMKLEYLNHYNQICEMSRKLREVIMPLEEIAVSTSTSLSKLSHHLASRQNQIKLVNICDLSNVDQEDHFCDNLLQNYHLLKTINESLEPRVNVLQTFAQLADILSAEIDDLDACLSQEEKAASLSIQEASFKFTLDNLKKEISTSSDN